MYQVLELIHVIAVILFLGNIITGLFWMKHADRTGNLRFIAHTMDGIIRSDRWFTLPGVLVIMASGVFNAMQGGLSLLRTGWIFWSIVAFALSGIIFGMRVAPLQKQILKLTADANEATFDKATYRSKSLQWELWGLLATLTPLAAVVMMVTKHPA